LVAASSDCRTGDAEAYLQNYAKYVHSGPYPFDFYVTFDYKMEASLIYRTTRRLNMLGVRPVPVYHGDSSIDWLKRYIDDGHKLVCLSKRFFLNDKRNLRRFYDQCFAVTEANGVACHGLACTGEEMWEYPWYSVDSTSVVRSAALGSLIYCDACGRLQTFSISKRKFRGCLPEALLAEIEARDLDLVELQTVPRPRILFNATTYENFLKGRDGRDIRMKGTLF
jgi:hypothetical protein